MSRISISNVDDLSVSASRGGFTLDNGRFVKTRRVNVEVKTDDGKTLVISMSTKTDMALADICQALNIKHLKYLGHAQLLGKVN